MPDLGRGSYKTSYSHPSVNRHNDPSTAPPSLLGVGGGGGGGGTVSRPALVLVFVPATYPAQILSRLGARELQTIPASHNAAHRCKPHANMKLCTTLITFAAVVAAVVVVVAPAAAAAAAPKPMASPPRLRLPLMMKKGNSKGEMCFHPAVCTSFRRSVLTSDCHAATSASSTTKMPPFLFVTPGKHFNQFELVNSPFQHGSLTVFGMFRLSFYSRFVLHSLPFCSQRLQHAKKQHADSHSDQSSPFAKFACRCDDACYRQPHVHTHSSSTLRFLPCLSSRNTSRVHSRRTQRPCLLASSGPQPLRQTSAHQSSSGICNGAKDKTCGDAPNASAGAAPPIHARSHVAVSAEQDEHLAVRTGVPERREYIPCPPMHAP